ncbi:hypothetical protein [Nostoc sp.]|uniref:hypothetical protein n=1 Tax=Nostoc sp. TaxID=1180 RepID=UPI002FF26CCC
MKRYDGKASTINFAKWLRELDLGDRFTVTNIPYESGERPWVAMKHASFLG